jgi:hypothetical protein
MNMPLLDKIFEGAPAPVSPPLTGEELRDSGIKSVLTHTPESYKDRFIKVVISFHRGYLFTVEDVRERAGDPPIEAHYNCMGGLMRTAASMKLIVRTAERRKAKRASLHASELSVWRRI